MIVFAGVGLLVVTAAVVFCLCVRKRRRKATWQDSEGGTRPVSSARGAPADQTRRTLSTMGIPNRAFDVESPPETAGPYEPLSEEDERRIRAIVNTMETFPFNLQVLITILLLVPSVCQEITHFLQFIEHFFSFAVQNKYLQFDNLIRNLFCVGSNKETPRLREKRDILATFVMSH